MQYLHYIEESKSWICPKSGVWKIICVGGGASGGFSVREAGGKQIIQHSGETTSFGSYISAFGGEKRSLIDANIECQPAVGQVGYDAANRAVNNGGRCGYGAGGDAFCEYFSVRRANNTSTKDQIKGYSIGGICGKIKSTIIDIEQGQTVFCTVGKGGTNTFTKDEIKIALPPRQSFDDIVESYEFFNSRFTAGADGVIITQYLGESM